jgi:hypothetical protein
MTRPGLEQGRRGGKPATNRLSYVTAPHINLTRWFKSTKKKQKGKNRKKKETESSRV